MSGSLLACPGPDLAKLRPAGRNRPLDVSRPVLKAKKSG